MAEEAGALNRVEEHENVNEDTTASTTWCGCFRGLYSRWRTKHRYELCQEEQKSLKDNKKNWFKKVNALLSLQRLRNSIGLNHKKKKMQFQYDAKSYALNFDDGRGKEEGDGVYLDFSSRYACPLGMKNVYLGLGAEITSD